MVVMVCVCVCLSVDLDAATSKQSVRASSCGIDITAIALNWFIQGPADGARVANSVCMSVFYFCCHLLCMYGVNRAVGAAFNVLLH